MRSCPRSCHSACMHACMEISVHDKEATIASSRMQF